MLYSRISQKVVSAAELASKGEAYSRVQSQRELVARLQPGSDGHRLATKVLLALKIASTYLSMLVM